MTLDQLVNALRGMPSDAPMLVATPDGLYPIVQARGGQLRWEDGGEAVYAITLELGERISSGRLLPRQRSV